MMCNALYNSLVYSHEQLTPQSARSEALVLSFSVTHPIHVANLDPTHSQNDLYSTHHY
jgi:hypothetical protein